MMFSQPQSEGGEKLLSTALRLVEDAAAAGIVLRLAGSLAVLFYCDLRGRPVPPADIDLVGANSQRAEIHRFLKGSGWTVSAGLLLVSETRDLFIGPNKLSLDVYYGAIDGSHLIKISSRRLNQSYPAICVADLLLSKLQRRNMRDVDIWDSCAILHLPSIGEEDERVLEATSRDWGLYMSVTQNLAVLKKECAADNRKADRLRVSLIKSRKSLRWHLRALVGPRIRWWREVYSSQQGRIER
jgi:hypothetical protein